MAGRLRATESEAGRFLFLKVAPEGWTMDVAEQLLSRGRIDPPADEVFCDRAPR